MNDVTVSDQSRELSPKQEVKAQMASMAEQLRSALPSHITIEKFQRVAMTAITSEPDLLYADRRSLFGAITRAAQDGLLPDKREGALVIFKNKVSNKGEPDQWEKHVQWMPMVAGILKKVRQSGEIQGLSANVVCKNDKFVHILGDDESIIHEPPALGQDRGEVIGCYAIATLTGGFKIREVMDKAQIDKVRGVSKTGKFGPWSDWYEEMARKTVIRRLSKRLPMSTDVEAVINDDATSADFANSAANALGAPQRLTTEMISQQASGQPSIEDKAQDTDPGPQPLFEQLCNRLAQADTLEKVSSVRAEFDARENEVELGRQAELEKLINDAEDKIKGNDR